jgi:CubicO group peptidase (beta-lactamase class C family)
MFVSNIVDGKFESRSSAIVPWWSFTKTVLAAAALKLVEQKRLDLDTPLEGQRYTLRHLLQHTSGLPDYASLKEYHEAVARGEKAWNVEELLRRVAVNDLLSEPGEKFTYSNIGYLFVRQIIEEATDKDINAAVNELVLQPLAIEDARFAQSKEDMPADQVGNHMYDPRWVYHGVIVGSLDSAVQLLNAILHSDFLSDEARDAMLEGISLQKLFRIDLSRMHNTAWV